ncbi:MAG: HAD-IA family hydrolase [Sediminicola sp.]|tara:strand:- start:23059 stop:23661 length:603 start_codon:yes stop_codon:yes gene_type:complete
MLKNLIFDFGDIFINLDKMAPLRAMYQWGLPDLGPDHISLFNSYEIGAMDSDGFLGKMGLLFPEVPTSEIKKAWNSIILDFPEHRLEFIENLASEGSYRLFLLSNTNALHIEKVIDQMGNERFLRFKNCFERFYLSHEIKYRKPDTAIFKFVLEQNGLDPSETFFVDDTKEHTEAAKTLGIKSWHLLLGEQDVTSIKDHL